MPSEAVASPVGNRTGSQSRAIAGGNHRNRNLDELEAGIQPVFSSATSVVSNEKVTSTAMDDSIDTSASPTQVDTRALLPGHSGRLREPLKNLLSLSIPLSLSQVAQFSITMEMMLVAGQIGIEEMGAISIALGLLNATAFAFGSGLCGALETVLSQSYGRDPNSKLYGLYSQRMFYILMVACVPLGLLMNNIEPLLVRIGQRREIAELVGRFCTIANIGLPFAMALELLRRYYAAQHLSTPVSVAVVAAALLNPIVQMSFARVWGYAGIPLGWVLLMVSMTAGLVYYLKFSGIYRRTWSGWSLAALTRWQPLLKLAIPSLGMALSEWTALEINSICAGFGTEKQLAGFAIGAQIASVCWSVTSGIFLGASVLVGNAIGEGKPQLARQSAFLSMLVVLLTTLINSLVVLLLWDRLPAMFNTDPGVVEEYISTVPGLLLFHILDSQQSNILGILRGCGMQNLGLLVVFFCYAVVGIPVGLVMFLKFGFGISALWIGPIVGMLVVSIPAYTYLFTSYIRWDQLTLMTEEVNIIID